MWLPPLKRIKTYIISQNVEGQLLLFIPAPEAVVNVVHSVKIFINFSVNGKDGCDN